MWIYALIIPSIVCFAVFFAALVMSGRNDRRDERRP
jgi:hypothetical protein